MFFSVIKQINGDMTNLRQKMLDKPTKQKLKKTIDFAQRMWYYLIKEENNNFPTSRKRYTPMG